MSKFKQTRKNLLAKLNHYGLSLRSLGGNSNNGAICGSWARNFNNDAGNANWNQRGRATRYFKYQIFPEVDHSPKVREIRTWLITASKIQNY